jgi:CBS domain-containing protein
LTTISNAMSRQVATISSNQTVQEAAELMSRHNIGAIPVVDQGVLKGMITDRDITLRTTAEGQDGQTPVSNVMTTNVVSGNPNMSLEEASQMMAQS